MDKVVYNRRTENTTTLEKRSVVAWGAIQEAKSGVKSAVLLMLLNNLNNVGCVPDIENWW